MTTTPETRAITIHVSDRVFAGLIDHGRRVGYTPTLYAQLLFEAAYAARVGKGEDDPLRVACVEQGLARKPAFPTRSAPPIAVPPPETVPALRVVPVPVLVPVPVAVPIAVPVIPEARTEPPVEAAVDVPVVHAPAPAPQTSPWSPSQTTFARLVCREEGASFKEMKRALWPVYQSRDSLSALISTVCKKLAAEGVAFEAVDIWGWRVEHHCRDAATDFLRRLG